MAHTDTDVAELKPFLTSIIDLVEDVINKLKVNDDTFINNEFSKANVVLNNAFSLSIDANELLDTLTNEIAMKLNQYIPNLSPICLRYLLNFFHTYHYDQQTRTFSQLLTTNILHSFCRELKGFLVSVDAFPAAFTGKLSVVKKFIENYPTFKDKPGLWGTTLLYSAARNNHLTIVRYLLSDGRCSVNAQNEHDITFSLATGDFIPNATAGSTALHAACYNGYLEMVQLLIQHGADYFRKNQAFETPIENGEFHIHIKDFFKSFLILDYSLTSTRSSKDLPNKPISEEKRLIHDCQWEYKSLQGSQWLQFTNEESNELHNSLQNFTTLDIHFTSEESISNVSMIQFLQSSKYSGTSWIRCRGSSILNFGIYSLWQMMLIEHSKSEKGTLSKPSLKILDIPTTFDSTFQIQLNSWYNCDVQTNARLDQQMNLRRKQQTIDNIEYIGRDLIFDLQTFTFSNKEKTIYGFVRWLPKLISDTQLNQNKILHLDNFQTNIANLNPIPLATKHVEHLAKLATNIKKKRLGSDTIAHSDEDGADDEQDELCMEVTGSNAEDDDDDNDENFKTSAPKLFNDTWNLFDNLSITTADEYENVLTNDVNLDDFFNEQIATLNNSLPLTDTSDMQPLNQVYSTTDQLPFEQIQQSEKKTDGEQQLKQQLIQLKDREAKVEEKQKQLQNQQQLTDAKIRQAQIPTTKSQNDDPQSHEQLKQLKHQKAIAVRQQQHLSNQEAELQHHRNQLKIEQIKLQQQLADLTQQTKDKKQQLEELCQKFEQLQATFDQKERQLVQLQTEQNQLNEKQSDNEKDRKLSELLEKLKQEEKQLIELEDQKNNLKQQIHFEKRQFEKQIEQLQDKTAQNNQQLNQLLTQLNEQKLKLQRKENQIAQLQAKVKKEKDSIELQRKQLNVKDEQSKELLDKLNQKQKEEEQKEQYLIQLQRQIKQFKDQIEQQQQIIKEQLEKSKQQNDQNQTQMKLLRDKLQHLQDIQRKAEEEEEHLAKVLKTIKTIHYHNLPFQLVNEYLVNRIHNIEKRVENVKQLPTINQDEKDYFKHKIPNLIIQTNQNNYQMTLTGFQVHHNEFKLFLQQILTLYNVAKKAIDYYDQHLKQFFQKIKSIINKVKDNPPQYWKQYSDKFLLLLQNKAKEYLELFDEFITKKLKTVYIQTCIEDSNQQFKPWFELRRETEDYMKKNPFNDQIEKIKQQALDEFVTQTIYQQQIKIEKRPTDKAKAVLRTFIDHVKTTLKNDKQYIGQELKHFQSLPELLRRIIIYYKCFLVQLPLYESADELLKKIQDNNVITISTSTGSGKSTLLPPLLIAEGYDKIIVTQPRRLPCNMISQRVNSTIYSDLSGWAVSGAESNVKAKIVFLTDGLFKERLLNETNFITEETKVNKSVVFFIDEVHERSINIDLCLALLARLLAEKPQLRSKIKVIISSATLDESVPNLYRHLKPKLNFDEFKLPSLGTLYKVTKHRRLDANILELVQELYGNRERERDDQILCFVNSSSDVHQCCELLAYISNGAIVAYPLVQSQTSKVQQDMLRKGSVFFSTTVAETSLTFPSLRYVVDTGIVNIPVYDMETKTTVIKEVRASQSTIKQRLGRLGRTKPGDYYALYDDKVEDPEPQICRSELTDIDFTVRKTALKVGINGMKQFLPDKPKQSAIDFALDQQRKLQILTPAPNEQFTSLGAALAKLPNFGSLPMSISVLSALTRYQCGQDLIRLSSILGVLNTSAILKSIPNQYKRAEGDFMTLLEVMNEILLVKQSVPAQQFNLNVVCDAKDLTSIKHILNQALRRYTNLEKSFNLSNEYREASQKKSDHWESIAKSLISGYNDHIFVSLKEIQGRIHRFERWNYKQKPRIDIAVLDLQSTLIRSFTTAPVSIVLARDVRYATSIRAKAVLYFLGEIKSKWFDYQLERQVPLTDNEIEKLNKENIISKAMPTFNNIQIIIDQNQQQLILKGSSGSVLDAELDIRKQLVTKRKFKLVNDNDNNINFTRNLESLTKMTRIFNPMRWRWEAEEQVEIIINNANQQLEISCRGRDAQNNKVYKEIQSFLKWLKRSTTIRSPDSGVLPRPLKDEMLKKCPQMAEKISNITDSKRTKIDLWNGLQGPKCSRETRMECVAWIAVCMFGCRLEGGFIRDWVVGNYVARPSDSSLLPTQWIYYQNESPFIHKEVTPGDLDCHLPTDQYFDIERFLDELHRYKIEFEVFREDWRYVLILDRKAKTGPFTMELIEPHVALTHDLIDFDVNNLSLQKDKQFLGMKVDVTLSPYSIDLESIVDNILNKRFRILRPIGEEITKERINKMESRGWKQTGQPIFVIPNPPSKYMFNVVALPESTSLYKALSKNMQQIASGIKIISIEQIRNPHLEETYELMKQLIAKECENENPNERELYHGTRDSGVDGILQYGYDDRFYNRDGAWGHGAYFADNPVKSHQYTAESLKDRTRTIYYNKVSLGKQFHMTTIDRTLAAPPPAHHSIYGTVFSNDEYITYRYGQALPYVKITYTTN